MREIVLLLLVLNGTSDYEVVLSKDASPSERWAAQDLVAHIEAMSGAKLPIRPEGGDLPTKCFLIGDGPAVASLGVKVDAAALGEDGFIIQNVGDRLVIAGGRKRGTMYGVYEFLSMLGCRWWAPGESTIPEMKTIRIQPMKVRRIPVLEYRDMLYGDLWRGSNKPDASPEGKALWLEGRRWCARNRIHAAFHEMPEELGPIDMDSAIAHGMIKYLPADKYMDDHPEWYALRGGKRMKDHICLSNMDAAKETARNVIAALDAHPRWRLITLGQADNGNFCTCDQCQALVEKHKANSGMIVHFINAVARIVKEKYPDVYINTNAYRWSQTAPEGIRCDDNVMITIPPIACNYSQPLVEGWPQENADYKRDLENWGKLASKIYVWDYTTDFVHYVMPWPNMHVIGPNVRFFIDNKVRGIFNQGSHTTDHGQFSTLVMWVLAQNMWNPEADSMLLAEEFCTGYYGPEAGPLVMEWIRMMVDKVTRDRIPVWATHRTHLSAPHLTPEMVARAEQLFRQAEAAVNDDPALLRRVEIAHFPVQYMLLRRPYAFWAEAAKTNPGMAWANTCGQFARVGRAAGIARVAEGDGAEQLYQWAEDVAKVPGGYPDGILPEELKGADPAKVTFVEAAQFDGKVRFLTRTEGATDGWAQRIMTHGWSITSRLQAPKDFTPGRTYRVFVRVMGKTREGTTGPAILCGIHHPDRKRVSTAVGAELMDGKWHTVEVGTWEATGVGGTVYVAWHPDATKSGIFVHKGPDGKNLPPESYIDCLWLVEQ